MSQIAHMRRVRRHRLGMPEMMVDGGSGEFVSISPWLVNPQPMPYTAPSPVDITPRPVASGPYPCGMTNRMVPTGGQQPTIWCNADGSPFVQANPLPLVVPIPPTPAPITVVSTPTSDGTTSVTPAGGSASVPATTTAAAAVPATNGIMAWLQSSMLGGIPNWVLLGGAAAGLLLLGGSKR